MSELARPRAEYERQLRKMTQDGMDYQSTILYHQVFRSLAADIHPNLGIEAFIGDGDT